MRILVTGASGFIGRATLARLTTDGCDVVAAVRDSASNSSIEATVISVGSIGSDTDWVEGLREVDVVIHCAARVHLANDNARSPLTLFRNVNVEGTLRLAREAAKTGVKRFIYISSIKVNGEQSSQSKPFTADDIPAPEGPYAVSKLEAEIGLQELAVSTGMDVVIIRPPLVYGSGVKGNFASMIRLVERGLPLPLGAVRNKRTLVALDNLVDLIVTCVDHPAAANQVFLAGDGEDLSTSELLRGVAKAMGKPCRLVPVPSFILRLGATLLGKKALAQRLLGSLRVDISKNRELLGWKPSLTVEEGLKRCFVSEKNQ